MRLSHQFAFAGVTAAAALVIAMTVAPAASAAGTITDNGDGSVTIAGMGAGDEVFFCVTTYTASNCGVTGSGPYVQYSSNQNGTFLSGSSVLDNFAQPTTLAAGTYNMGISNSGAATVASASGVVIGGGLPSSTSTSTAPAAVVQQFGLPAAGTCEESAPANLDWAGVGNEGWGTSWAAWMNNDTGGQVCTRTLSYVGSGWAIS